MFDDLKEKIEDLVNSVKSKLPGSKADDDDEYEDDEGEFDEKTEEIDVASKADAELDEDEEYDEDEEDDEDEAKAKKQKVMRLGLVGLVLVLGASILMDDGGEDENALPAPKPIARKRPKRKKKVVKKNIEKVEKKEKVAKNDKNIPAQEAVVAKDIPEEVPSKPAEVEEESTPKIMVVENELKLKDDKNPEEEAADVQALGQDGFDKENSASETLGEGTVNPSLDTNNNDNGMSNALDTIANNESPKMIEKVVKEKLEYQEPPNYLETGRGLVYNCAGRHWACVDQTSYIDCKKNNDWSKQNEKEPECYPSNVYGSFKDCRTIQIYNINTITETDFCKK